MYGELILCLFVPVTGLVITEAPTYFIPPSDEEGESLEAIDLTKKQDDGNISEDTTKDNESDSRIKNIDSPELSPKGNEAVLESPPDDITTESDTKIPKCRLSESLLSPSVQFNGELSSISGTNMKYMSNRTMPLTLNNECQDVSSDCTDPNPVIYPPSDERNAASADIDTIPCVPECDNNTDKTTVKNTQETINIIEAPLDNLDVIGTNMESECVFLV